MADIITLKIDEISTQLDMLTKDVSSLKKNANSLEDKFPEKPLYKRSDLIQMSGGVLTKYIINKDVKLGRIQTVPRGKSLMFPRDSALNYLKLKKQNT